MSVVKVKPEDQEKNIKGGSGPSSMERKSNFSLQNFIKEPTTRLPTFRPHRDLSLGGTKPKKVYTPNLNVTRLKNKPKEIIIKDTKRGIRIQDTKPNLGNNKFVQLEGVFSEGSGNILTGGSGHTFSDRSSCKHEMPVPKIRKKALIFKDTKKEEAVADDLLQDSGSDDDTRDIYSPFVLNSETFVKKVECKMDDVKSEEDTKVDTKNIDFMEEDFKDEFLKHEQYSDSNICFSLIQFPDSFAGRVGSENTKDNNLDVKLSNVGEGKIGKIIIRRSGRMQLQIGNKLYELNTIRSSSFMQDVVAQVDEDGQKKMGKLGSISTQYVVTPDWQHYLQR